MSGSVKKNIQTKESLKKRNVYSVIQGTHCINKLAFFILLFCQFYGNATTSLSNIPEGNILIRQDNFTRALLFLIEYYTRYLKQKSLDYSISSILAAVKKLNGASTDESVKKAIGEALKHVPKKVRAAVANQELDVPLNDDGDNSQSDSGDESEARN